GNRASVVSWKYCEMIKVENLTKRYAGQPAIRDLNFEVSRGEIMGFLGPNGAGKTTTMRILASFMPPTSGRATIAGFDVFEQSLQARAHLGYMPENVPLYSDMRVTEYLRYRAALKGVQHRRITERVGDVKELCGLKSVENKLIGALSKGYRQRVGLADELKKISGVREVITDGEDDWKRFSLRVESGVDVREEIFRLATERHWAVRELTQRRATLEDVFVEITHSDQA